MSNLNFIQVLPGSTIILNQSDGEFEWDVANSEFVDADVDAIFAAAKDDPDVAPMTDEQRAVLFAEFNAMASRDATRDDRHAFTRAVLGTDDDVSWARHGDLSVSDADRLIEVLRVVNTLI